MTCRKLSLFFLLLLTLPGVPARASSQLLDSLLHVLDETIGQDSLYTKRRESEIFLLQRQLREAGPDIRERLRLQQRLAETYEPYLCDSAIVYRHRCIALADSLKRPDLAAEERLRLAYLLSATGMYVEALDVLREIDRKTLSPVLQVYDNAVRANLFGEVGAYTQDPMLRRHYWDLADAYKDTVLHRADPDSEIYLLHKELRLLDTRHLPEALALNARRAANTRPDTRARATVFYYRALIYREMGDTEHYRICLALSAIADIRSAVKDHASLWMLAQELLDDGDLERAYRYMDFSWSASSFYHARLRAWQSVEYLSVIDNSYQQRLYRQNAELKRYIAAVSILTLLLFLALAFIWRQVKRLRLARRELLGANNRLHALNDELQQMNADLQQANLQLREANTIKENYLARFIKLCSTYVDRLDAYRHMVSKKIAAGQTAELLKVSRSPSVLDEALDELYSNFDSVFLRIFPDFVAKFNALLRDGEQIWPKTDGHLTTELRIFALIRLGITDSSQIAEFLHYSVNTIYNYRARVKNKARSREDFEQAVSLIS